MKSSSPKSVTYDLSDPADRSELKVLLQNAWYRGYGYGLVNNGLRLPRSLEDGAIAAAEDYAGRILSEVEWASELPTGNLSERSKGEEES